MPAPLFDGHCDSIWKLEIAGGELFENPDLHVDLKRGGEYRPYAQFFAIFDMPGLSGKSGKELFDRHYGRFLRELEKNRERASFCRSGGDAQRAASEGKIAAFLSVEGAELVGESEDGLRDAYDKGVRAVNITWNFENSLSGSNDEGASRGLTKKGRGFVKLAQELGVVVDVSHLSEPGFWDVLELAVKPVMASHSNSAALCPHRRNLSDAQFEALARNGGTAGINLCDDFLGVSGVDLGTIISHIEHFLSLGGEKSVALGCDFDGITGMPEGFSGIQDLSKLYEALLQRNYPESLVEDIFYNNLMEVVRKSCGI